METENSMIAFAQALIRQQSVSGEEGPAAELVVREMQRLGYDEAWIDEQGNAVGVWNGARAGRTVLLDGHIDTVGIAPGTWRHEPFGAEIEDGYLYGRGAADMKGAIAAMVYGVAAMPRAGLAGRAVVSASVMEENLEGAALQPVVEWAQPDLVVIGEATGLNLARGGRGRAEIHLETIGRPAHSSTPHLGRNAVHDMIRVIAAIEATPPPQDPVLGPGIMALTDIISDPYPAYSVIASRCRVTYDRRLLPGETAEELLAHLRALPIPAEITLEARIAQGEHQTYTGASLRGPKFLPAWLSSEDEPFVQAALERLLAAGLHPKLDAYRFCTNAAYTAGTRGIPTLGFGPGTEENAHVVDERVEVAALEAAAAGYRALAESALAG